MKFTSQQSETISLGFLFPFKIASNLVEAFSLTREIKCQLLYEFLYHTKPSWLYSGTGGLILVQNSLIFRPLIFTDFSDHCPCPYCSSRAVTSAVSYLVTESSDPTTFSDVCWLQPCHPSNFRKHSLKPLSALDVPVIFFKYSLLLNNLWDDSAIPPFRKP